MKRLGVAWLLCLMVVMTLVPAAAAADNAVRHHVILLDGSGSMEDPPEKVFLYSSGKLQRFVQDLVAVEGAFGPKDQITLGIFSKADAGITSPTWVYRGTVANLRAQLPQLKPLNGWTDLIGSLEAGSKELQEAKETPILWLLTDNIDQDGVENESTERFYTHLAGRTDLVRMYVFPVDLKEKNGLVLYAMAQDRGASHRAADGASLDQAIKAINGSALKPQLGDGGFMVRPLADQGLAVEVTGFLPDAATSPEVVFEKDEATDTFALRGFREGQPVRGKFKVLLTSKFPSLRIVHADVEAELVNVSSGDFAMAPILSQKITPTKVSLEPGQTAEYTVELEIAPPSLTWDPLKEPAGALADEGTIRGELRLVVTSVTFAAVQPDKYFKVQRIPEILGNKAQMTVPVSTPVVVHVGLPWWRVWMLIGFVVVPVAIVAALVYLVFFRRWHVRVTGLATSSGEVSGTVRLAKPLEVPGFGIIKAVPLTGLVFVPDPKTYRGERKQNLSRRRGTIELKKHGRSCDYEIGTKHKETGGKRHERAGNLY